MDLWGDFAWLTLKAARLRNIHLAMMPERTDSERRPGSAIPASLRRGRVRLRCMKTTGQMNPAQPHPYYRPTT